LFPLLCKNVLFWGSTMFLFLVLLSYSWNHHQEHDELTDKTIIMEFSFFFSSKSCAFAVNPFLCKIRVQFHSFMWTSSFSITIG
jgi:hypothetical protein